MLALSKRAVNYQLFKLATRLWFRDCKQCKQLISSLVFVVVWTRCLIEVGLDMGIYFKNKNELFALNIKCNKMSRKKKLWKINFHNVNTTKLQFNVDLLKYNDNIIEQIDITSIFIKITSLTDHKNLCNLPVQVLYIFLFQYNFSRNFPVICN